MEAPTPLAPDIRFARSRDIEAEIPGLHAVNDACRRAAGELDRGTLEGFRAFFRNLENCDPASDLLLAWQDDAIVGYARVWWSDSNDGERWYETRGYVHPDHGRRGIGRRLFAWTEARRLQLVAADERAGIAQDRPRWFTAFNYDGDVGGDVLIRAAGYEPFRQFFSMLRPDLAGIDDRPLPPGLELRPIPHEPGAIRAVIAADSEAFRDHFGSIDDDEVVVAQILEDPDTDTSLWLVAFDGDEIAGAILNGVRPGHDGRTVGWLDSVFTRRPWRQRGLARALIARSLDLLRERGAVSAALGVDTANPNQALGLYESAGFRRASSTTSYRKPIPNVPTPPQPTLEEATP
jgi:mycothiol synthase